MKEQRFTAEDFEINGRSGVIGTENAAAVANIRLESWLGPVVYGAGETCHTGWTAVRVNPGDTHAARLFGVQRLEVTKCDHKNRWINGPLFNEGIIEGECIDCGAELKAKWEVAG